jgi:hypothetical protein
MRAVAKSLRLQGALALCTLLLAPVTCEAEASTLEYQVKAVFILRIAQLTEWPRRPAAMPFVIGVMGDDPFGPLLDQVVKGELIEGHPIVVRRYSGPDTLGLCDLLLITGPQRSAADRALKRVAGKPTLTVADFEGFVGQGGAVELFISSDRVRFRIDRKAAEAAGLSLRSQLLRAAALVKDD